MANRCSGRTNSLYFIWFHIKIVICWNFDIQNCNAEINLENQYDSSKIGMAGISGKVAMCRKICMEKSFKKLTTRLCLGLRVCMSVDWALVFPSLLLEGSSSTNMNGFCVNSLKVKGVNVFKKLTTRLCLGLIVCISVDWALVFPSLLLEGSSSTNMKGFCVTSLKVKGVNVFKKLTTRLCLGLRVCISVDWALVFSSLLLEGSSSTNMNGFCVNSLKVKGVNVFKKLTTRLCLGECACL